MSAMIEPSEVTGIDGTFWTVAERDERGYPIELRRLHDVERVVDPVSGETLGYRVGCHPSRLRQRPEVIFKPEPRAALAHLDCYAVAGDTIAASLARFHERHPDGPQTPEEHVEEQALRAGFVRRRN